MLDLRASDYGGGSTWKSRIGPNATVYGRPKYDGKEYIFFDTASQVAMVPINTDGHDMPSASYSLWAKLPKAIQSGAGWALSQTPDHGWSRAITLNDGRLSRTGGVSITMGGTWANTLPKPPVGSWFHVVATWVQGGQACVYLNGKAGLCTTASNGKHASTKESLCIGGRGPNDSSHNPSIMVKSVQVYKTIISSKAGMLLLPTARTIARTVVSWGAADSRVLR